MAYLLAKYGIRNFSDSSQNSGSSQKSGFGDQILLPSQHKNKQDVDNSNDTDTNALLILLESNRFSSHKKLTNNFIIGNEHEAAGKLE